MKVTLSNGPMLFIALCSVFISNTTWAGYEINEIKWIAGANKSCYQICHQQEYLPVSSGTYINNKPFYICSANAEGEGYRPGFNLNPNWENHCYVEYGEQVKEYSSFKCLCVKKPSTDFIPAPGLQNLPSSGIQMAPGYVAGQPPSSPSGGAQSLDLAGTWFNNMGMAYQFSQSGNQISYHDPILNQLVHGTVDGKTISVSWTEGRKVRSVKGTITSIGSDGRPKIIQWENGFIFSRK